MSLLWMTLELRSLIMAQTFPSHTPGTPKTIMLVEDNTEVAQHLVQAIKENTRHYVFLINDARKAIDIARALPPDLFLFDTQLPGTESQDWPHRLHTTKGLEHVPALLVNTGERGPYEEKALVGSEASDGVRRIENMDVLMRTIQELLT
jgi:DNA-binding response OmpR family regulator